MIRSLLLLHFLFFFGRPDIARKQINTDEVIKECKSVYGSLQSFVDWPVRIDCSSLIGPGVALEATQCTNETEIKKLGTGLEQMKEILYFSLVKLNNQGTCITKNFTVDAFVVDSRPKIDDVNTDVSNRDDVISVELSLLESINLPCLPPNNVSLINGIAFPPNISYDSIWRISTRDPKSNSSILKRTLLASRDRPLKKRVEGGHYPPVYKLNRANYYKPGIYSCEIRARKRKVFVVHYSVCVHEKFRDIPPIVECNSKAMFERGENLSVYCSVLVSNGGLQANQLELAWAKESMSQRREPICSKINVENKENISNIPERRISCGWKNLKTVPVRCVDYSVPDDEKIAPNLLRFRIYLNVTNAVREDASLYLGRLRFYDLWSEEFEIKLIYDRKKDIRLLSVQLFATFGGLIFVILTVATIWCNKTKILLFRRRHFGTFDEDHKDYVATLYYYADNEMNNKDLEYTRAIVEWTKETLTKLDFDYLDNQEKYQPGYLPEMILSNINRSLTFILILTRSFCDDNNSMFIANQGYLSMLQNQTKLVIITAPGVVSSIKQKNHKFSKQVLSAIKGSNVIKWKKSTRIQRFQDELEYALPNIDRSKLRSITPIQNDLHLHKI